MASYRKTVCREGRHLQTKAGGWDGMTTGKKAAFLRWGALAGGFARLSNLRLGLRFIV